LYKAVRYNDSDGNFNKVIVNIHHNKARKDQFISFNLSIESLCTHEVLKLSISKTLELHESQVDIYLEEETVDNFDDAVVVKVSYSEAGFRTHIEIINNVCPQYPLPILKSLSRNLQSRIIIDALDIVPIYILGAPNGRLSYVNCLDDDEDHLFLALSVQSPCSPFYRISIDQLHPKWESKESQSDNLISRFTPYIDDGFTEIHAEFRVSNIQGYEGQLCEFTVSGINTAGASVFLDVENISEIARLFESICVLSGGVEDVAKNEKFRITSDSLEMEQDTPGRSFVYHRES